jgi:hypothetical protein
MFPGALVASVIASFPLHLVLFFTLSHFVEPYPRLPEQLLSSFVSGGVFVWVGAAIAPEYKSKAAIALFAVQMLLLVIVAVQWFEATWVYRWWHDGAELAMGAAGAAVGLYIVRRKVSPRTSPKLRLDEPVLNEAPS